MTMVRDKIEAAHCATAILAVDPQAGSLWHAEARERETNASTFDYNRIPLVQRDLRPRVRSLKPGRAASPTRLEAPARRAEIIAAINIFEFEIGSG